MQRLVSLGIRKGCGKQVVLPVVHRSNGRDVGYDYRVANLINFSSCPSLNEGILRGIHAGLRAHNASCTQICPAGPRQCHRRGVTGLHVSRGIIQNARH